jgi:hypothetical protein
VKKILPFREISALRPTSGRLCVLRAAHAIAGRFYPSACAFVIDEHGGASRVRSRFDAKNRRPL